MFVWAFCTVLAAFFLALSAFVCFFVAAFFAALSLALLTADLACVRALVAWLRSACAYVGTDKLKDLSKCTTFVRVNRTHNTVYG